MRDLANSNQRRKTISGTTEYPHIADLYPKPLDPNKFLADRNYRDQANLSTYQIPPETVATKTVPKQLAHYTMEESSTAISKIYSKTENIKHQFNIADSVFNRISHRVDQSMEQEGPIQYKPSAVRRELTSGSKVGSYTTSWGNKATGEEFARGFIEDRARKLENFGVPALREEGVKNAPGKTAHSHDSSNDSGLPFPPCPECGHVIHSSHQAKWSGRAFASMKGFLTPEECKRLESLAGDLRRGTIGHDNNQNLDNDIRRADIGWIEASEASAWLYERLWSAIPQVNERLFNYDIQWLEPLQYSVYRADDHGGYAPHYDWGNDARGIRKLSFSIQLTEDKAYTGGDLVIWAGHPDPVVADREIGTITVFPSWMLHTVTPVEQGVRKSLVGWFEGPVYF